MNMGHLTTCRRHFQFSIYQFDAVDLKRRTVVMTSGSASWVRKPWKEAGGRPACGQRGTVGAGDGDSAFCKASPPDYGWSARLQGEGPVGAPHTHSSRARRCFP